MCMVGDLGTGGYRWRATGHVSNRLRGSSWMRPWMKIHRMLSTEPPGGDGRAWPAEQLSPPDGARCGRPLLRYPVRPAMDSWWTSCRVLGAVGRAVMI